MRLIRGIINTPLEKEDMEPGYVYVIQAAGRVSFKGEIEFTALTTVDVEDTEDVTLLPGFYSLRADKTLRLVGPAKVWIHKFDELTGVERLRPEQENTRLDIAPPEPVFSPEENLVRTLLRQHGIELQSGYDEGEPGEDEDHLYYEPEDDEHGLHLEIASDGSPIAGKESEEHVRRGAGPAPDSDSEDDSSAREDDPPRQSDTQDDC